jgi:hypothetical protein
MAATKHLQGNNQAWDIDPYGIQRAELYQAMERNYIR